MMSRRVFVYLHLIHHSGFSGSDDVDEVAINGGGMDVDIEGLDLPNSWQSVLNHPIVPSHSHTLKYIP
jgi:hypothetical protein